MTASPSWAPPPFLDRITDHLGMPLMVKPAQGGSGLGAAVAREAAELPAAMVGCFAYDATALVERYIPGTDIAVSVVDLGSGPTALPAVEIVPRRGVYDHAARHTAGLTTWHGARAAGIRGGRAWRRPLWLRTRRWGCATCRGWI